MQRWTRSALCFQLLAAVACAPDSTGSPVSFDASPIPEASAPSDAAADRIRCVGRAPACEELDDQECGRVRGCELGGCFQDLAASCFYAEQFSCTSIPGCELTSTGSCGGEPRCRSIDLQAQCDDVSCHWSSQCHGRATACGAYEDAESCAAQRGCRWLTDAGVDEGGAGDAGGARDADAAPPAEGGGGDAEAGADSGPTSEAGLGLDGSLDPDTGAVGTDAASADGGDTPTGCEPDRGAAIPARVGADVVFVLDGSGSMLHASAKIQANLTDFVQSLGAELSSLRVVMITGSDPAEGTALASDTARYLFVQSEVDSGALFGAALSEHERYASFLRSELSPHYVFISDDDDLQAADAFEAQMEMALGRDLVGHAVASEDVEGAPCTAEDADPSLCVPGLQLPSICTAASIGTRYYALAAQTGGQTASVCRADWSPILDALADEVAASARLPCEYALRPGAQPERVTAHYTGEMDARGVWPRVDAAGACGGEAGWYFNATAVGTTLALCPAACTQLDAGGSLDVEYTCAE